MLHPPFCFRHHDPADTSLVALDVVVQGGSNLREGITNGSPEIRIFAKIIRNGVAEKLTSICDDLLNFLTRSSQIRSLQDRSQRLVVGKELIERFKRSFPEFLPFLKTIHHILSELLELVDQEIVGILTKVVEEIVHAHGTSEVQTHWGDVEDGVPEPEVLPEEIGFRVLGFIIFGAKVLLSNHLGFRVLVIDEILHGGVKPQLSFIQESLSLFQFGRGEIPDTT